MTSLPKKDRILRDIEFELLQGAVAQNDLGRAIEAARQHHNRTRSEVFETERRATDTREIASRQFQINDMLITLLQEMALKIQEAHVEIRQLYRMLRDAPPAAVASSGLETEASAIGSVSTAFSTPHGPDEDPYGWPPAEVEQSMSVAALQVELAVRPARVPLLGRLLTRLRNALHSLALFYIHQLAGRQAAVNETYGNWILHLYRLQQHQHDQIVALSTQLAALQTDLTNDDPVADSSRT
jgi:hypothetical protein